MPSIFPSHPCPLPPSFLQACTEMTHLIDTLGLPSQQTRSNLPCVTACGLFGQTARTRADFSTTTRLPAATPTSSAYLCRCHHACSLLPGCCYPRRTPTLPLRYSYFVARPVFAFCSDHSCPGRKFLAGNPARRFAASLCIAVPDPRVTIFLCRDSHGISYCHARLLLTLGAPTSQLFGNVPRSHAAVGLRSCTGNDRFPIPPRSC